ncbi:MAG: PAS domain-containing protein [Proteobacteria bacterium]|nr:PAS domain-containing protein [Pseudomonadota bacterium]MBU1689084.1 PAS domain-containing protein [Pseudomonadota bacterium]
MQKPKKHPDSTPPSVQGRTPSLAFLRAISDSAAAPLIVIAPDFRIQFMNRVAIDTLAGGEDLLDTPCHRLIANSDQPCIGIDGQCPLVEIGKTGKTTKVEYEKKLPDGTSRFYEVIASPLHDDHGSFQGIVETLRDITEQEELIQMLMSDRENLDRLFLQLTADFTQAKEQSELLYRVIPSAIFTVNTERVITTWNNKAEDVTGYRAAEVLGKTCTIFALDPCTSGCGVFSDKIDKPIIARECLIRTKDGQVRTITKNADLLHNSNGMVIGAVESFEDITNRKKFDKQLRAERDKFRSMLTALNQGMHILNRNYLIEYQNDILKEAFGDQVGRKCYEIYKRLEEPCEICRMQAAIEQDQLQRTELLMTNGRFYEQSYVPFTDVDGETKVLIMLRDISEEKAKQAETMRAAQLASIGELAAGVAHEINNPINGIINYAQILLDEINSDAPADSPDPRPASRILPKVINEGERIAAIVSNLLSFARQGAEEIEDTDVEEVMVAAIELINHQLNKEGIDIAFKKISVIPAVRAIRQHLQQIFLNLLSNARHALNKRFPNHDDQKKIEIEILPMALKEGNYIRTTVTDHGCGIPPEFLSHIFEPFFTLKDPGEGTGLGLSISHGLIKDLHGFITAESELGTFTRITVDLPMSTDNPHNRQTM